MLTNFIAWINSKIVETGATAVYLPLPLYLLVRAHCRSQGQEEVRRILRIYAGHLVLFDVTPTPPCPRCGDPLLRVTRDWYECTWIACTDKDTLEYGAQTCVRVVYPNSAVPRIVRPREE